MIPLGPRFPGEQAKLIERDKIHERQSLTPAAVHDVLLREGHEELERHWSALALSGLAAAFSLGLSFLAQGALRSHLPEATWAPLLWKAGYAFGFIALTLGRQQLYTESTLIAYLPLAHDRSAGMFRTVLRLWVVVLAANLLGAFLFALALSHPASVAPSLHEALRRIGLESASHTPFAAFLKGIFGGWIIALMIWLLPAAETGRITVIFLLTWLLGVAGFTHIIAGSIDIFYVVIGGDISWWVYVLNFGLPTLAGNTIGGMLLVAALNRSHATGGADGT